MTMPGREFLEQLAHLLLRHSHAGIRNGQRNPIATALLSLTRINADGATLGKFVGIALKVQQCLP
jgi:hypothetical protein